MVPVAQQDKLFPLNRLCHLTDGSNDDVYLRYSPRTIAGAYLAQGKTSWLAVEDFVEDCLHEGHDFILEGHQVHPRLAAKLLKRHPQDIRAVFLVKSDVPAMVRGFKKNRAASDWVLEKTVHQETLVKIAETIASFGRRIGAEAVKYGLPVRNMDRRHQAVIRELVRGLAS
jgi:2-phosphoglycerate kinase